MRPTGWVLCLVFVFIFIFILTEFLKVVQRVPGMFSGHREFDQVHNSRFSPPAQASGLGKAKGDQLKPVVTALEIAMDNP